MQFVDQCCQRLKGHAKEEECIVYGCGQRRQLQRQGDAPDPQIQGLVHATEDNIFGSRKVGRTPKGVDLYQVKNDI